MYIRFTILEVDSDSKQEQGLFVKSYNLLKENELTENETRYLRDILSWFESELIIPKNDSIRNQNIEGRAIFWYRSSAKECVGHMWELANILRAHGYAIEVKTCRYFGNIAYSDKHQIAIYPHQNDGPIITK